MLADILADILAVILAMLLAAMLAVILAVTLAAMFCLQVQRVLQEHTKQGEVVLLVHRGGGRMIRSFKV